MTTWLERYQQGESEPVWAELVEVGAQVREAPSFEEALAVARETMRRARTNIELLVPRLQAAGYVFGYAWLEEHAQHQEQLAWEYTRETGELRAPMTAEDFAAMTAEDFDTLSPAEIHRHEAAFLRGWAHQPPTPFLPPAPDVPEHLDRLEALVGPLPLSLHAWYEVVGEVDFVGKWPSPPPWSAEKSQAVSLEGQRLGSDRLPGGETTRPPFDPLAIYSLGTLLNQAECEFEDLQRAPQHLRMAPDSFHKYNVSGAGPYAIAVPNASADGVLLGEWHQTTFVNYLRICFRWAGLPGLSYFAQERGKELLNHLTADLLPL